MELYTEAGNDVEKTESKGLDESNNDTSLIATVEGNNPTGLRLILILLPLCLGTLLVAIDNIIIAVAIPQITSTFHTLDEAAWYGSGYLLTVTAFQPTFGKIYKYFNVKLVYLESILVFEGKYVLAPP